MSRKIFEIEMEVAKILASQYYRAINNTDNSVNKMTLREYYNKSLINWIDAARGIISLVKNGKKENF